MNLINLPVSIKLYLKHWEVSWRFKYAHHPLCLNYKEHVWKVRGIYLCQGCTLVYSSFVISFLLFLLFQITLLPSNYLLVGIGLLVPILIIESIKVELRVLKRFARVGIGLGLGLSFSAFILHADIVIKVSGLLITLLGLFIFRNIRKAVKREDKCLSCIEYEIPGICSGLQAEAEAMRKYSDYASDLLHIDLKRKFLGKIQD